MTSSYDPKKITEIHNHLHSELPSDPALRVKALESLLVEKGMVDSAAVDAWIDLYAEEIGPKRGARVVARAWTDPAFKTRLLADGTAVDTGVLSPLRGHSGELRAALLKPLLFALGGLVLLVLLKQLLFSFGRETRRRAGVARRGTPSTPRARRGWSQPT